MERFFDYNLNLIIRYAIKLQTMGFNSLFVKNKAFTLAEVLITLSIIGVVAALTIPNLMNTFQEQQYRTAYKKAYSDISQALLPAISEGSITRANIIDSDATSSEWTILKGAFKVTKECTEAQLNTCWADGDKVWSNTLPNTTFSQSFIDVSGRSWAEYRNDQNIYLVDTNGFKNPNKFGKDRWLFKVVYTGGDTGAATKTFIVAGDLTSTSNSSNLAAWCQYPPCYYASWLFNLN